jgi:hypothetical protein
MEKVQNRSSGGKYVSLTMVSTTMGIKEEKKEPMGAPNFFLT